MAQGGSSEASRPAAILIRYISKLTGIFSTSPVAIAMDLTQQGIIAFEVFDQVRSAPIPSFDRSAAIMAAVCRKVQADGDEALGMFLEVLKRRRECAELALSIEWEWRSKRQIQPQALESGPEVFDFDTQNDLNSTEESGLKQRTVDPRVLSDTNDLSVTHANPPLPIDFPMNDLSSSPLLQVQPIPAHTSETLHSNPVVSSATSSQYPSCIPHDSTSSRPTTRSSPPIRQLSALHVHIPEVHVAKPCQFVLESFSNYLSECKTWHSPLFYTHEQGYKLRLEVHPGGEHVSIYARLMKGEYDESLSWPMCCDLFVSMLNWRNLDYDPKFKVISFTADCEGQVNSRVLAGECAEHSWGFSKFISIAELLLNEDTNTEYVNENCITININAEVHAPPDTSVSKAKMPTTTETVPYTYAISDFSKAKDESKTKWSEPFLSHRGGYKLSLQVYPNGNSSGSGTHVSVFARLHKGENDDCLLWPFSADVVVEIVNIDAEENYQRVIHFSSESGSGVCSRVTKGDLNAGFGYPQYIAHSDLEKGGYIQEGGSLLLCVREVVIYSSLGVSRRPTWYDSEDNILCGFSVVQFSKHKQYNRIYYSDPFFFRNEYEYRFRCTVYANGSGHGRDRSVSCFLQLMRGRNDDDLEWPFRGQILIEILNWQENKHHIQKIVTFDGDDDEISGQVLEREVAPSSLGSVHMVSHSDLVYSPSKRTQYIREDCVYLRIRTVPPKIDKTADSVGEKIATTYKAAERFITRAAKKVEEYID